LGHSLKRRNIVTGESNNSKIMEMQITALLAEYNKLETNILEYLRENHDLSIYSLLSTAGIATLIATLSSTKNQELLASLLLLLPFPFMAMYLTLLGNTNSIINMGNYVGRNIENKINSLLSTRKMSIMDWEMQTYRVLNFTDNLFGPGLRTWGQFALVILPSLLLLIAYQYILLDINHPPHNIWTILYIIDICILLFELIASIITAVNSARRKA
jgi:hypothetical protein